MFFIFNLIADVWDCISRLEELETRSDINLAAPFFEAKKEESRPAQYLKIAQDLLQYTKQGDCIAPFFLQWMKENSKLDASIDFQLDTSKIPMHLAQGQQAKYCFETYLELFKTLKEMSEPQVYTVHARVNPQKLEQQMRERINRKFAALDEKLKEHARQQNPIAQILKAKLFQHKYTLLPNQRFNACLKNMLTMYSLAVLKSNLWAVREFGLIYRNHPELLEKFSKDSPAINEGKEAYNEERLAQKSAADLIEEYTTQLEERILKTGVLELEETLVYKLQKWKFALCMQGEHDPFFMTVQYLEYDETKWGKQPRMSLTQSITEARKWFNIGVKKASEPSQLCLYISRSLKYNHAKTKLEKLLKHQLDLEILAYTLEEQNSVVMLLSQAQQNNRTEMLLAYEKLHQEFPVEFHAAFFMNEIGCVYEQKNDLEKAAYFYRKALEADPASPTIQFNVAHLKIKQARAASSLKVSMPDNFDDETIELLFRSAKSGDRDSLALLTEYATRKAEHNAPYASKFDVILFIDLLISSESEIIKDKETGITRDIEQFTDWIRHQHVTNEKKLIDVTSLTIPHESSERPEIQQRAWDKLLELGQKLVKNLTLEDFKQMHKLKSILAGKDGTVAVKQGAGSRINIESETVHETHKRDRMSRKGQNDIAKEVRDAIQKLEQLIIREKI
ncbi:MAG: tetratricopeptide repeat protein [Alphaproteobacteria bacterium]|nr:MAG: tetratricopeptide repeat protein [Alphaproteobacteria bacterium]